MGRFEEAHETLDRALHDSRSLRTPSTEGFALHNLGMSLARLQDLDSAIEHERMAEAIGERTSHFRLRFASRLYETLFLTWRGEPGDLAFAHTMVETIRSDSASHPISYLEATGVLAQVQLARGKLPACMEACEDAFSRLTVLGTMQEGEEMLRLVHVEALLRAERIDEARAALDLAYRCVMGRAEQMSQPFHREAFLSRLYECRRIIELSAQLLGYETPEVFEVSPPPAPPRYSQPPGDYL